MKNAVLTLSLLTCLSLNGYAQIDKDFSFKVADIKEPVATQPINALQAHTPHYIISYNIDTTANNIAIVLRRDKDGKPDKKGYLLVCDIATAKILWSKELKNVDYGYSYSRSYIIHHQKKKNVAYSRKTGMQAWENKAGMVAFNKKHDIAVTPALDVIDLSTGRIKWPNKASAPTTWYDYQYITDSIIFISGSNGIQALNVATGKLQTHKLKTLATDVDGASVAVAGVGVALGILTGTFVTPTDVTKTAHELCSPIYADSGLVYFASRESVACYDKNGTIRWETPLPEKKTSRSSLYFSGSNIIMINTGHSGSHGARYDKGQPYIASFNKKTGKQTYLNDIDDVKALWSYIFTPAGAYIRNENNIWQYNISNGRVIRHDTMSKDTGPIVDLNTAVHIGENGEYEKIGDLYPTSIFFLSHKDVLRYDEYLKPQPSLPNNYFWSVVNSKDGIDIIEGTSEIKVMKYKRTLINALPMYDEVKQYGNYIVLCDNHDIALIHTSTIQ